MEEDSQKYKEHEIPSGKSSVTSDDSSHSITRPDFVDFARQLAYDKSDGMRNNEYFQPYQVALLNEPTTSYMFPSTIINIENIEKKELKKIPAPKTNDTTTLFLIDSMNRDKTAFPQPTNFTLRLPRVYKNVKSIQVTQLKLLCSFYYFSTTKGNIYLPVIEKDRVSTIDINGNNTLISKFNNTNITKLITIREGTYTIPDLLNEIQTEMNYTPLFYDFPGGFTDFIKVFTAGGDYSVNFNQPGDTYYDTLNNKIIKNPTMNLIVSYYWGTRYAGLTDYSIDQLKVAYYYPVFYEVFLDDLDTTAKPRLNLTVPSGLLSSNETIRDRLIFNMTGINDSAILYLINNNIDLLDTYRLNHTFRYSLVNRYELSYDPQSLQISFTTVTLNTSLVNLINNTGTSALTSVLNNTGLTSATYTSLQASNNIIRIVYADMFQFLQNTLVNLLGISYATYTQDFFNNMSNILYFQDGLSATGINSGYTSGYLQSGNTAIRSTSINYSNSPGYWPLLLPKNGYQINTDNSLIPYNMYSKNFQFGDTLIDSSNYYINIHKSSRSVEVVANILPAQYTIFKFRSPVRQSLQVETLPIPYYYRYSDYNAQGLYKGVIDLSKKNVPQQYFDISYAYLYNSVNKSMDNTFYSTTKLFPTFGQTLTNSIETTNTLRMNSQNNYAQFEFVAPYPTGISTGIFVNNTQLSILSILTDTISTIFPDTFSAFVYHDRAAFMADLLFPRSENPLHYIKTATVDPNKSDITINFSTFSGHTYYTIFRSDNISCSNILYKPLIYSSDTQYTQVNTEYVDFDPNSNPTSASNLTRYPIVTNYNLDFIRLPSTVSGINPENSIFNTTLDIKGPPIGYDISGVSNDLTDYIGYINGSPGFIPNSQYRIDPLSQYTFNYNTPFNTVTESYFGSNSSNSILSKNTLNLYTFKGISTSQTKIVHWYDDYSISRQLDDTFTTFSTIAISQTSSISSYINSYPLNSSGNIQFGRGIQAIGFLPEDGVYSVSSFSFKSSIYPLSSISTTSEDPNLKIKYIGVFNGLALVDTSISLSSALTVLRFSRSIPYGPGTINNTPGFGVEFGTWYEYMIDPSFNFTSISGYTQNSNDLLSYNSMYYMVPFNSSGISMTYSLLKGSLVPYPKAQNITISSIFFNQTATNAPGATPQKSYVIPTVNLLANKAYGPQGNYSQTQSQYEQSMPVTTASIGFKEYPLLVDDSGAPFIFDTLFSNRSTNIVLTGVTTFFSEYSSNLFLVNSVSTICSNINMSFPSATYASSLSTVIGAGTTDCIHYLIHPASPQQNYDIISKTFSFSTFTFKPVIGGDSNIITQSIELSPVMNNITLYMWGAGGGTWRNTSTITGGAGAYVKVTIDVHKLLNTNTLDAPQGISTLYMVIGKGGNRDNTSIQEVVGSLQQYEQPRYGGGGTSILGNFIDQNSISLQGGGFSGIFSGSNLQTATPLLIVGGGGAAGSFDNGGPGGFGIPPSPLTISIYPFSSARLNSLFYNKVPISTIRDVFGNPVLNGSNIQYAVDNNFLTYWDPVIPAKLNPGNYNSTPNTYGISLEFANNLSGFSKLRYYGPPQSNTENLPTGILIYNDVNKSQLLYSNTSIRPKDFQLIDNGQFIQQIFDILPFRQPVARTINTNTWLVAGQNTTPQTSIQYSLDGFTWVPTNNLILSNVTSIHYVAPKWYASGSKIIESPNGIDWTPCTVNSTSGIFTTLIHGIIGTTTILIAGTDNGSIFKFNGTTWIFVDTIFSVSIKRIKFLNGMFWAISSGSSVKKSSNGIEWIDVIGISNISDITFGIDRYVISQANASQPYNSTLLFSQDGTVWSACGLLGLDTFSGLSLAFTNNTFVAVGLTTRGSFIKYSIDGINWLNSTFTNRGCQQITDIQSGDTGFICTCLPTSGIASNQASIITSVDGIHWSYSLSGGFDENVRAQSSGYGHITISTTMSKLYMEIQSVYNPRVYELRVYDTAKPIVANTRNLIDANMNTTFYLPNSKILDVLQYSFLLTHASLPPKVNKIRIYTPINIGLAFSDITIQLSELTSSTIYSDFGITGASFRYDAISGKNIYEAFLIPAISSISLYINFTKITVGSIQLSGIQAVYDPNMEITQKIPFSITDINNRNVNSQQSISNIKDTNLLTSWNPATFLAGDVLRMNVTFSTLDRINHIQIYSGLFPSNVNTITGISVYTDSTKVIQIYSNLSLIFRQYNGYSLFESNIPSITGYTNIYIELYKTTPGLPIINEIKFFNIGQIIDTQYGYSGGNSLTMTRSLESFSVYNGSGGSSNTGGASGKYGIDGSYLTGGSPAILPSQISLSNTSEIRYAVGGGGGGYYGGGGGGLLSNVYGGAGGGGSGYIFTQTPIFNTVEYGTASPRYNYLTPASSIQVSLLNNNIIENKEYGQGGIHTIPGEHGIIVVTYETDVTQVPPDSIAPDVIPAFIDGSKLTLFQAPILNNTDIRKLNFTTYSDPIETTGYSGYNWVWYRSYLSLVGCSLTSSLQLASSTPIQPPSFPSLHSSIYQMLSTIFVQVVDLFTNGITQSKVLTISSQMELIFNAFQAIFITTSYLNPSYIEMTEIYCILDYLRDPLNLQYPHVNPFNPQIDRLFGGVPRFGYWANPFLTNVSYIGFDVNSSQIPPPSLSTFLNDTSPVQAMYGLVLEQSLSTGKYMCRDIMAYKPSLLDASLNGSKRLTLTQFPESYVIRSLTNERYSASNIPVQPYTFKNAITARLPLFNYTVYTAPTTVNSSVYNIPIQILNDFEGSNIYMYSLQNINLEDQTSIHISKIPLTSTMIQMNQLNINKQLNTTGNIIGTLVSEYSSTIVQAITSFGFNGITYEPKIQFSTGSYNTFIDNSPLANSDVGKAITDMYGNYYMAGNNGSFLYENICTTKIYAKAFTNTDVSYASPKFILSQYNRGNNSPFRDYFTSKYDNLWHLNGIGTIDQISGVRFNSPYDYKVVASFANQVFYPTHKISLIKNKSLLNPMRNVDTYSSYQHTQMFFYKNYSKMMNDINGKFAMEKTSNFSYADTSFSGYGFNSYIYNINLEKSTDYNNENADSFNYVAIRAYSPSETFQTLVRFYLPQRYDFGYISLYDLSNELHTINTNSTNSIVNPHYNSFLTLFNQAFSTTRIYGSSGLPGYLGSNISTTSFGDFLRQYNILSAINTSNNIIISSITGKTTESVTNLIKNDLQYILPSYLTARNRTTDPVTFSIPFSSCVTPSNKLIEQYGLGYNLGFALIDTQFNTVHRATSFFKILDDYIYLQMNPEYNMNKMDISMPENFTQTLDTTAQSALYNSKLLLNNFGQFATTFVQCPVNFNPTIGKLDKLSFSWYSSNGTILNNADCEWSGTIQIVESINLLEFNDK